MYFDIISDITDIETMAINRGIREVERLRKHYGAGRWRKRKGRATVRLPDGTARVVELPGMKPPALAGRNIRLNTFWTKL